MWDIWVWKLLVCNIVTGIYEKYDIALAICVMGFPMSGTLKILELKNACLPVVIHILYMHWNGKFWQWQVLLLWLCPFLL